MNNKELKARSSMINFLDSSIKASKINEIVEWMKTNILQSKNDLKEKVFFDSEGAILCQSLRDLSNDESVHSIKELITLPKKLELADHSVELNAQIRIQLQLMNEAIKLEKQHFNGNIELKNQLYDYIHSEFSNYNEPDINNLIGDIKCSLEI